MLFVRLLAPNLIFLEEPCYRQIHTQEFREILRAKEALRMTGPECTTQSETHCRKSTPTSRSQPRACLHTAARSRRSSQHGACGALLLYTLHRDKSPLVPS